jgi:Uma2 family endonuclease
LRTADRFDGKDSQVIDSMEAYKLKTLEDLLASPEERVELIDGEVVRRPMARSEHGIVQSRASVELSPFDRKSGPGGWWIITEVSVAYEPHQCPSHDIAGWRKERMPERPRGVIELAPDWVCEIVSPGHERKDTLQLFLLLQRHRVPFYWLIWPEDRVLIAHQIDGEGYRVIKSISGQSRARIPPFEQIELDLAYVLGE